MVSRGVVVGAVIVACVVFAAGGVLALDADGDDLGGVEELRVGTDPLTGDTDGDGLSDGDELEFGSDPTLTDTDDDGLDDHAEHDGGFRQSAGGGGGEYVVEWRESDPRSADTDGDGLTDGEEAELGLAPTRSDSDGDGLSDPRELEGSTDPADPDTDGDTLKDSWEIAGETDTGAPLPGADPLHKDMYVQVTYLRGVDHRLPSAVFWQSRAWFAEMPIRNPDGETGIRVRFYADGERSGPIDASIDEWTKSNGQKTAGVSGFMAMREFYNREYMGPRVGSYFLVVVPDDDVPVRGHGNAGGTKTSIVRPWPGTHGHTDTWAHTITHELLHNVVRRVGGNDCDGRMHTCEGFLSYEGHEYLSERTKTKLNRRGFARPIYREQMNATSCEAVINDPAECGT